MKSHPFIQNNISCFQTWIYS